MSILSNINNNLHLLANNYRDMYVSLAQIASALQNIAENLKNNCL